MTRETDVRKLAKRYAGPASEVNRHADVLTINEAVRMALEYGQQRADAEAAAMRERAAGVAETCEIKGVLTPGFPDGASSAATQIATAIRALPTTEVGNG